MELILLIIGTTLLSGVLGKENFTIEDQVLKAKFNPPEITNLSMWDGEIVVNIEYELKRTGNLLLKIEPDDTELFSVKNSEIIELTSDNNTVNFTLHGHYLGFTQLNIYIKEGNVAENDSLSWRKLPDVYKVTVYRPKRPIDTIFIASVSILVIIAGVMMGSRIDVEVVKEVLRRPYAPCIGFCTQFVIMPPLAFGIAKMLSLDVSQSLGIFAAGCAPGGGASNMYTYLLDGDLSLSITMTTVSTLASLGMIPLWMFTLGQVIMNDIPNIRIPYENICITLISIIAPVCVGILLQRKAPVFTKKMKKFIRPFFVVFIIFMFTFAVYVNLYIFRLFTAKLLGAGMLLPWAGFALGALVPLVLRQTKARILTIAIETGIQNVGVPILLLLFSLKSPAGDIAIVGPIATSIFTPVPLVIAITIFEIRKRCFKSEENDGVKDGKGSYALQNGDYGNNGPIDHDNQGQGTDVEKLTNGNAHVET